MPSPIDTAGPRPDADPPADLIEVGRVVEAYGVRGGLKVQPHSASPDALLAAQVWWLRRGGQSYRVEVDSARRHGAVLAASWSGVADRDAADAWRGWTVWLPRSGFPAAGADEFYWVDLIGCLVTGLDEAGQRVQLGVVGEVSDNGAHAVLHVSRVVPAPLDQPADPLLDGKGRPCESLVPFVDVHVRSVDLAARRIDSDWPVDF